MSLTIKMTNTTLIDEAKYGVYILYQKELQNCDHIYLQSMMDWIYLGNDSPYKFRSRNQAYLYLNNSGVTLSNENPDKGILNGTVSWDLITFKLKHLKEIYVDKRNKDTCVLVSKISVSSFSNYVWKKANQINFSQMKPSMENLKANKKNYLVTVLKFKDGHGRLLESIQYLDKILNSLNSSSPESVTSAGSDNNSNNNIRTSSSTSFTSRPQVNSIYDNKVRSNAQAYFTEIARNQMNTSPEKRTYQTYAHIRTNLISSSNTNTYSNKTPSQVKNDSMTLPRPLSTSSIRDVRSYTPHTTNRDYFTNSPQSMLNSRHSLTPTSFSNMYNMSNMTQQQPHHQYGVFPMRRSASRTSYSHTSPVNSSFDNTSEIGYTQYANLMSQGDQAQSNKSSTPLQTPYFMMKMVQQPMNPTNQSQERFIRSSRDQRPTSMVDTYNSAMNLRSRSVNDRMSFAARPRNESVDIQRRPKHEYFTNGATTKTFTEKKPFVQNNLKNSDKSVDNSSIKNSIIDENLELIKAEFDSLKLKKEEEEEESMKMTHTKTNKHSERSTRRSSTSSYLDSAQKRSATPRHTVRTKHESLTENKPAPMPSFLNNESSRLKDIIDSFNSFEKNLQKEKSEKQSKNNEINETILKVLVDKKDTVKKKNSDTTSSSPSKTKGLIQYFSNNSKSQLDEQLKQKKDSAPQKSSQQTRIKTLSPISGESSPQTLVSGQTSPYTVEKQTEFRYGQNYDQKIVSDHQNVKNNILHTNYDNQKELKHRDEKVENIFNQIFNNKPTIPTNIEPLKPEDNSHLTMSIDSLESSQLSTQTPQTTSTTDVLNNSLYNNNYSGKKETVYDLATYGIDDSVVQGELEPIFKPIVLQKRSKNQMGRKRTFANMIWPMSAEEEMILRSNSPFVVPEVISTRTDQKRGILKRTQSEVEQSNAMVGNYVHSPITTRKRVDFHENYLFVSFFDVPEPEPEEQPELINYNTIVA